jgi:hypothetical protein
VLAAEDKRVKAVVALIPHISVPTPGLLQRVGLGIPIVSDLVWRFLGYPPTILAVTDHLGDKAVMTADRAVEWIAKVTEDSPNYKNEVTLANLLQMVQYNAKSYARSVKVPLLAISVNENETTPASKIHDAMDGMANVKFRDYPGSHFGLFGEYLDETVVLTTEFLNKHL